MKLVVTSPEILYLLLANGNILQHFKLPFTNKAWSASMVN